MTFADIWGLECSFMDLFDGRPDAVGSVHGQCVRLDEVEGTIADQYRWHLESGSIGVYPIVTKDMLYWKAEALIDQAEATSGKGSWGDHFVKWGVTDLDKGYDESWPATVNLARCLSAFGLHPWVERTKGKGYHVWVFADTWVPAEVMRRAFLAAHQIVGVPPTEVNPKQTTLSGKGFGNYVNLPYAGNAEHGKRVVLLPEMDEPEFANEFDPMSAEEFADSALRTRDSFDALLSAARLYKPPAAVKLSGTFTPYDGELRPLVKRMGGLAHRIFVEGVLEGRDRSRTLMRLAHLLAEGGFEPGETKACVVDADKRFGKFRDRINADEIYDDIVRRAHAENKAKTADDEGAGERVEDP